VTSRGADCSRSQHGTPGGKVQIGDATWNWARRCATVW